MHRFYYIGTPIISQEKTSHSPWPNCLFAFALPKTVDYYDTDSGTSLHGLSRWFFCLDFESIFLVYSGAAFELSPNQNMLLDLVPKHVAIIDKY